MANKADLERLLTSLEQYGVVDASGADLSGADLSGMDFSYCTMHDANLSGANLSGAIMESTKLKRANLSGANLRGANMESANLESANLHKANLTEASLRKVYLHKASLVDADLSRADLSHAVLDGARLERATLAKTVLSDASLLDAILRDADLRRADLGDADLRNADLTSAKLDGAYLAGASLSGAKFYGAYARAADFRGATMINAKLDGADFSGAVLQDAFLRNASLRKTNLSRAQLDHATLIGADLTDADLSDSVFSAADFTRAVLVGTNVDYSALSSSARGFPQPLLGPRKALGKYAGPLLKLQSHAGMRAREFKQEFPAAFERLKPLAKGQEFTPRVAAELVTVASGPEWIVVADRYKSEAQRLCPTPNEVLLLGIQLHMLPVSLRESGRALAKEMVRDGHPTILDDSYLTVGWVRYCPGAGTWLIEEVQSDLPSVRRKHPNKTPERYAELLEAISPWLDRFYEDAMAILFDLAQREGAKVEMLTYESKKKFRSPRSVYEDLPRRMGMTRAAESAVLPGHPVWEYTPNRARYRIRRRRI